MQDKTPPQSRQELEEKWYTRVIGIYEHTALWVTKELLEEFRWYIDKNTIYNNKEWFKSNIAANQSFTHDQALALIEIFGIKSYEQRQDYCKEIRKFIEDIKNTKAISKEQEQKYSTYIKKNTTILSN